MSTNSSIAGRDGIIPKGHANNKVIMRKNHRY